jgi:hypothetical protein
MPDVNAADFQRMRSERDAARAEKDMWRDKYRKLEQQHATVQTTLQELMNVTGAKPKKAYEYGKDECKPVMLGQICEKCQWDYRPDSPRFMMRPTDKAREPHPSANF